MAVSSLARNFFISTAPRFAPSASFGASLPRIPLSRKKISDSSRLHLELCSPSFASGDGGVLNELIEESKFVPLGTEDLVYGPPALLLLGFEIEEAEAIRHLLMELEGEFLQVIFCTEDMVHRSLWDAVHTKQDNPKTLKVVRSLPRICFLSGLSGEETMMFIDAFHCSGLEPTVFAALVPNSSKKLLTELVEEIMADHEMMANKPLPQE